MQISALDYLCCPKTKCKLILKNPVYDETDDEIITGELVSEKTGISYPIISGVPNFIENLNNMKNTEKAFSYQWKLQSKGYFQKNVFGRDNNTLKRHFFDYFGIKTTDNLKNKVFLDAGCGLAPYAKFFAKTFPNAISIGIDITDSVMLARKSNLKNLHLVRGDLRNPPLRHGVVDIGWSYGVLHHTLDTKDAFFKLQKYIKKLGKFYIWVYSKHRTKYSFLIRKFFFKSYKYPAIINVFLSYTVALIPFVVFRLHYIFRSLNKKVKPLLKKHKYLNIVIGIHDSLVPEYQYYHNKKEVVSWFKEANFNNIKIVGDVGVVGTRSNKSFKEK